MNIRDEAGRRSGAIFDATADHYDDPANSFRERFGRRTVERLDLQPGMRVLDVCCGTGAATIPAAEAVGASGSVLGVDLAENLLELARRKAANSGLANVEFRAGDLRDLRLPAATFEAVICAFGIFFVPDMDAALRGLWRLVAPGGKLAITTWGPRQFEPLMSVFWESVGNVRPDLRREPNPWDGIAEPDAVCALFAQAEVGGCAAVLEPGTHPLGSPRDWWALVLGTRYRGTVEALEDGDRDRVRQANINYIRNAEIRKVETNVIYAVAAKSR